MKHNNILIYLFFITSIVCAQQNTFKTYKLYNNKGKEIEVKKLIKEINQADLVFLGELHNNPISHWFYFQLIKEVHQTSPKNIQVGAEMFELDNQIILTEYFKDIITEKKFEDECRLWNNYKTDYKPTLEYCKENSIDFYATNIPRRYASAIYNQGESILDSISNKAKSWIVPFPIPYDSTLSVYKNLQSFSGHGGINLAKAQAYKDATMAFSIDQNLKENHIYFHLNGNKHSEEHQAILWYMLTYGFSGKQLTIHTEVNANLTWNETYKNKADFILIVQEHIQ